MRLAQERQLIADYGRRLTGDRLVVGTSGNLSIRAGDLLAVTPAGHAYDTLTPELVCVQDLDGTPVEGELAPTSELPFHQLIYQHTDAAAVVHTHSTAATVVSTVVDELPTIHYILAVMGGPIRGRLRHLRHAGAGRQRARGHRRPLGRAAGQPRRDHLRADHRGRLRPRPLPGVGRRGLAARPLAARVHPRVLGEAEMDAVYAKIQGSYGTTGRPRRSSDDRS